MPFYIFIFSLLIFSLHAYLIFLGFQWTLRFIKAHETLASAAQQIARNTQQKGEPRQHGLFPSETPKNSLTPWEESIRSSLR